jgi:hypothetical protein
MSEDEFEPRIMHGGLPPLPGATHETEMPPRMPKHAARLRAELIRRSDAYLAAQLARAAARGRRTQ